MVARGYAVLLPDPGLSTGYGHDFVGRGYGDWGPRPYADLMAITDATVARPDIDQARTAAMGGSYGGEKAYRIGGRPPPVRARGAHAPPVGREDTSWAAPLPPAWRRPAAGTRPHPRRQP